MCITPWLKSLRNKLRPVARRADSRRRNAETLEQRTLLTVVATIVDSGTRELIVTSDGSDDQIRVLSIGLNVDVQAASPGEAFASVPITSGGGTGTFAASSIDILTINGGDGSNLIDLSLVTQGIFGAVNIDVNAGDGADLILGATDIGSDIDAGDGSDTVSGGTGAYEHCCSSKLLP